MELDGLVSLHRNKCKKKKPEYPDYPLDVRIRFAMFDDQRKTKRKNKTSFRVWSLHIAASRSNTTEHGDKRGE